MTSNSRRAVVAGALVLVFAVALAAADAPRGAFGVGVLRQDGAIIPFATFDGKRWGNAWPAPALELTVPIDLRSVPSRWWGPMRALESWQAWTGGESETVHIVQPDWVNVHCVRHIVLRSDYRSPLAAPPPTVQPYPKDGLVVSPPQAVERITTVPVESAEARALLPALLDAFNLAERRVEARYGHPVSRRGREGRVPTLDAVYALGDHPRVYYVEAGRGYRQLGGTSDCTALAFSTGWLVRDGDDVRSLDTVVDLLGCDRRGASFMLPLGAMRVAGRLFWLAQFSGWDHERFVVVEVKPKAVEAVLSVWGGSC